MTPFTGVHPENCFSLFLDHSHSQDSLRARRVFGRDDRDVRPPPPSRPWQEGLGRARHSSSLAGRADAIGQYNQCCPRGPQTDHRRPPLRSDPKPCNQKNCSTLRARKGRKFRDLDTFEKETGTQPLDCCGVRSTRCRTCHFCDDTP